MSFIRSIEYLIKPNEGLEYPSGLCFNKGKNELYICDMGNERVISYNLRSKIFQEIIPQNGRKEGIPKKPLAITRNQKDDLYITDAIYNCLFKYTNNQWEKIISPDNICYDLPGSIACDDIGNIYFTDFLHNRICFLEISSGTISVIEKINCLKPYGIYIHNKILYITDTARGRIQWYHTQTREQGVLAQGLYTPIAIMADKDGDIYFSESKRLYLYHKNTKQVETVINADIWRSFRSEKLYHLGAMAAFSESKIICSDTVKNSIYVIQIQKSEAFHKM